MYAEFFGLRELPFNNTPDPRFFYSTPDHEEALASLIYAVKERKGFVLLTGEVGAGKTLVSRIMLRHFGGAIAFANINHAVQTAGDLMESLCSEFELSYEPDTGNAHLVRILHDFLLAKFAQNTPVVLLLDEAQNLPVEAFEQLRMIGNLEADDAKLLQIAMVGQPELQRLFQSPQLRQLRQRIFRSYHLPALDRTSTDGYIRYRLSVAAGKEVAVFTDAAIDRVYAVSGGLPRIINTICDNAMLSAYSADCRVIEADFLESVLAQMMLGGDIQSSRPALSTVGSRPPRHRSRPATPLPAPQPEVRPPPATAPVASTKARLDLSSTTVDEARALRAALEAMTGRTGELIRRGEELARILQHREQRLEAVSQVVRKVAGGLNDLLSRVEKASVQSRRGCIAAQQIRDHLAIQTQRARQTADDLSHSLARAASRPVVQSAPLLVKAPPVPVAAAPTPAHQSMADPSGLEQMLSSTRESLCDLRQLARGVKDRHAASEREEPHAANRLAQQVESLLDMVGSRA